MLRSGDSTDRDLFKAFNSISIPIADYGREWRTATTTRRTARQRILRCSRKRSLVLDSEYDPALRQMRDVTSYCTQYCPVILIFIYVYLIDLFNFL